MGFLRLPRPPAHAIQEARGDVSRWLQRMSVAAGSLHNAQTVERELDDTGADDPELIGRAADWLDQAQNEAPPIGDDGCIVAPSAVVRAAGRAWLPPTEGEGEASGCCGRVDSDARKSSHRTATGPGDGGSLKPDEEHGSFGSGVPGGTGHPISEYPPFAYPSLCVRRCYAAHLVLSGNPNSASGQFFGMVVMLAILLSVVSFCIESGPAYRLGKQGRFQEAGLLLARNEAGIGNLPDVARAEELEEQVRLGVDVFAWVEAVCVVLFTFEYLGRLITTWARPEPWQEQVTARWEDELEDALEEDEDSSELDDEAFMRFLTSPQDEQEVLQGGDSESDSTGGASGLGRLVMRWDALSSSSPTRIRRTRTSTSDALRTAAMDKKNTGLRVRRASRISPTSGLHASGGGTPKTNEDSGASPDPLLAQSIPSSPMAMHGGDVAVVDVQPPDAGGESSSAKDAAGQEQETPRGSDAAVVEVAVPRISSRRLWTRRCRAADHMLRARGALFLAAESAKIAADAAGPAARISAMDFAGDRREQRRTALDQWKQQGSGRIAQSSSQLRIDIAGDSGEGKDQDGGDLGAAGGHARGETMVALPPQPDPLLQRAYSAARRLARAELRRDEAVHRLWSVAVAGDEAEGGCWCCAETCGLLPPWESFVGGEEDHQ